MTKQTGLGNTRPLLLFQMPKFPNHLGRAVNHVDDYTITGGDPWKISQKTINNVDLLGITPDRRIISVLVSSSA